jgi:hypothetical protein
MLEARVIKSLFQRRAGLCPRPVVESLYRFTRHFLANRIAFASLIFDINFTVSQ